GTYYYTSATDCLNGVYTPAFPCAVSYLVVVGTPSNIAYTPPATPTPISAPPPPAATPTPLPAPAPAAAPPAPQPPPAGPPGPPDSDLPVGHFYTQTAGSAGSQYGYRITNEGGIGLWSEFQRLGGVAALGYPVSRRFVFDGYIAQATQKVLLQWRPEANPPQVYFANVFDKLHDLGQDSALQTSFQIPPQLDPALFDAGKSPDQARADRLALLNADPAIAARYNAGQPSPLLENGLPTSTVTNQGPFLVVRAERTAIQHWLTDNPASGIRRGDVTVVNGGDVAKQLGLVPADAAVPETINGQLALAPAPPAPPAPPPPSVAPTPAPPPVQAPPAPSPAAAAAPAPMPQTSSQYPWVWKSVNTPPVDCGANQVILGWLPLHQVPCIDSAPNAGVQYVSGHVLNKDGSYVSGFVIQATAYGNNYDTNTNDDGTFTLVLSNSCPLENRVYSVYIVDGQGRQSSNVYTVNYSNCNVAGEFHFDFVKNS
ncbi:MAG TPA: hypothetical protein VKU60_19035, partial [Chloroflexota bacterium]|nr:hypothetical protein [Chloroflexota bacterium]